MRQTVIVLQIPGLGHALAHDPGAAASAVTQLDARWRAVVPRIHRLGQRWVHVEDEPGDALEIAFRLVREGDATAVLDEGTVVEVADEPWSYAIWRAGRIAESYGRPKEVLVTDLVRHRLRVIPEGVGLFAAPAELSRAAGVGLWRLLDAR